MAAASSPSKGIRVLLVAADGRTIETIGRILSAIEEVPVRLESADSLARGREILARGGIDAVLLDSVLPDGGGAQAISAVHTASQGAPTIVLGESDDPAAELEAIAKGAQDYLVKGRLNARAMARILRLAIERQKAKTALEKAVHELQHLNRLKSDFISSVSHELHTPLTVIIVAVNNFLDGIFGSLDETQARWIRRIKANAERLTGLINDILDLSKLESGRARLNLDRFDACELLNRVLDDVAPLVQGKGLTLRRRVPAGCSEIFAAKSRIEQVVVNLITNSMKYTPAGGEVSVALKAGAGSVRVEVADTGIGIDPSKLEIVFERFLQLSDDKTTSPGIGLGLAICKQIVLLHHGKIWAESEGADKGSRFIFELPTGLEAQKARKPTVLIVDDDPDIHTIFLKIAEDMGFQALSAKDGAEAIAQIVSSEMRAPIDLLIADLMIPVRNGLEVMREMKRVNPNAYVVIMTGYHDSRFLEEAMEVGAFTLLKKPFRLEEVERILRSVSTWIEGRAEGAKL